MKRLFRAAGKDVVRAFGIATSRSRPLPDFLIIGAHRAGTTSLHSALFQHPCIVPNFPRLQRIKGVRFFDEHFFRGTDWYRSHFATSASRRMLEYLRRAPVLAGEASPYYLFHPLAADRAFTVVPEAKLIVLLRNPLDRAYSHWRRERREGREPLERFEDAIAAEDHRLAGEVERIVADDHYYSYAHENFSYLTQGCYADGLQRWLARYPRQRVCIQTTERLREDFQGVYQTILEFLGLPRFAVRPSARLNADEGAAPLSQRTRRELAARIAPDNVRLERLLGIHFGWNTDDATDSLHTGTRLTASGHREGARSPRREYVPGEPVAYAAGRRRGHD